VSGYRLLNLETNVDVLAMVLALGTSEA